MNLGHRCDVKGCGSVLVLDGNMKNARTVCACNGVGELRFEGIGGVVIGKYRSNFGKLVMTVVHLTYLCWSLCKFDLGNPFCADNNNVDHNSEYFIEDKFKIKCS